MKHLTVMLKPASSLCNMRCRYCFYADVSSRRGIPNYGIMSPGLVRAALDGIWRDLDGGDELTLAFQGGEPTLAGLDFFRDFVEKAKAQPKKIKLSWSLQTNGMTLDEEWCVFLRENHFLVGLSLDGDAKLHNLNRADSAGKGSFARVMKTKNLLEQQAVDYNVLTVLTGEAARHPARLWKFILGQNIRYIQFIPCLPALDAAEQNAWALNPKRFYSFYTALFPLWQKEALQGNYISVKLYDDIVNLFVKGQVTACGLHGHCQPQTVIESDGSVYPCDFYVLDEYRLGNIADMGLREIFAKTHESGFLTSRPAPPEFCADCPYKSACGGGCKRMERSMYLDESGFCGYRAFLSECLEPLCRTGRALMGTPR